MTTVFDDLGYLRNMAEKDKQLIPLVTYVATKTMESMNRCIGKVYSYREFEKQYEWMKKSLDTWQLFYEYFAIVHVKVDHTNKYHYKCTSHKVDQLIKVVFDFLTEGVGDLNIKLLNAEYRKEVKRFITHLPHEFDLIEYRYVGEIKSNESDRHIPNNSF